jgi:hypothetical protein
MDRDWGQMLGLPGFGPVLLPFPAEQIPTPTPGKTRVFRPARIGASHFMDGIVAESDPTARKKDNLVFFYLNSAETRVFWRWSAA